MYNDIDVFQNTKFSNKLEEFCRDFSNESNTTIKITYQLNNAPETSIIIHPTTINHTAAKKEKKGSSHVVAMLMLYINENLHEDLSLSSLAEKSNYHPSYLSRLFKQEAGVNPSDYILKARINKAKELLVGGKLQINKIAKLVGYSSSHSFARIFKSVAGASPQEYKNSRILEDLR